MKGDVAILGGGILGSSIALNLARKKIQVKLFDREESPFTRASKWNEGKIHLGFLYSADNTMRTAKKLIPPGLNFPRQIKELIGRDIPRNVITQKDDHYLISKDSIVDAGQYNIYSKRVHSLLQEHPNNKDYFIPLNNRVPRLLKAKELKDRYNTDFIKAAFQVPERSIRTSAIADYFNEAIIAHNEIELMMKHDVLSVNIQKENSSLNITTALRDGTKEIHKGFKVVINALWEGRAQIDKTMNAVIPKNITHRYRVAVFAKTKQPVTFNSAVIAVGPFGDVKNYDGRNIYLSWYDTGLLAQGHDCSPPSVKFPDFNKQADITQKMISQLTNQIPELNCLIDNIESYTLNGGWVFAEGKGLLDDPKSGLHRRDQIRKFSKKGYFSIDTGKFSLAPWLAKEVSNSVLAYLA